MMKRSPDANDNEWGYLNVCYLQSTLAVRRGGPVVYYMSLLAFAAVMRQMEMVKMLISIENGAGKHVMLLISKPITIYSYSRLNHFKLNWVLLFSYS